METLLIALSIGTIAFVCIGTGLFAITLARLFPTVEGAISAWASLQQHERSEAQAEKELFPDASGPWLQFPCKKCQRVLYVDDPLEPGQMAVVRCPQCQLQWQAVLLPVQVEAHDSDKYPNAERVS